MQLTPLDKELQEIALKDWDRFVQIIGEENIVSAKVCLLRKDRKSYGKIKIMLGITKSMIETRCKRCDEY